MPRLFKKESHYMWTLVVLVCLHVLYMTYLFPRSCADTPLTLALIDKVAEFVPALRNLQQHVPTYTNYWGMFYAVFWVMAPIYWGLGFVGSFFLSPYRYEKLVVQASAQRVWWITVIFFVLAAYAINSPMVSYGMSYDIFMNQMSDVLPKLIVSWVAMAGILYSQARGIGALIIKFNLNRNH